MKLAIGMTTAPREEPYVGRAYSSLRAAGFDQPLHLFLEPDSPFTNFEPDPDDVVRHFATTQLGCFLNWKRALSHLAYREDADWVMVLQDDVIWRRDGRAMVEAELPAWEAMGYRFGFASPYTSPAMVPFTKKDDYVVMGWEGWVAPEFHNNAFWGALAMIFSRESAQSLLTFDRFRKHDHHRKVDVVVGNCMRDMGREMRVAVPSLCDHIGERSTLGRDKIKGIQWGRRGFAFDETRGVRP